MTENNNNGVVNTVPAEETEMKEVGKHLPSGCSGSGGVWTLYPWLRSVPGFWLRATLGVRRRRDNSRQVLRGQSGVRALKWGAKRLSSERGSSSSKELSRAPGRRDEIGRVGEFQLDKSGSATGTWWGMRQGDRQGLTPEAFGLQSIVMKSPRGF